MIYDKGKVTLMFTLVFKPLKQNIWATRGSGGGGVVEDIIFKGGTDKCTGMKVPRLCPLVFLVKDGRREDMAFGSG